MKEFIVETEMIVTTRYLVFVKEDENPWDVWKVKGKKVYLEDRYGKEKAMSVTKEST